MQAGHREQYAIPRALAQAGVLDRLVTDLWVPPGSWPTRLPLGRATRRLRDRFHPALSGAPVRAFPWRTTAWEAGARFRSGNAVLAHNDWWSTLVTRELGRCLGPTTHYVFSYCYGARTLFAEARRLELKPVLGQIDPGPVEDRKVAELVQRHSNYRTAFVPGSKDYYAAWREECAMAETIVVNSEWSRRALQEAGIEAGRIVVCPLVYTPPPAAATWRRSFVSEFTSSRPLRVLFLGQCNLRKGIAETIAAAQALAGRPVAFTLVGNTDIAELPAHFGRAAIRYVPRVSRAECERFFQEADVFLFPTHSDGFGLTQLEAQAWKLPVIVSRYCGEVVRDGETGWVLPEVSAEAIVAALETILTAPALLVARSAAITPWPYGLAQLADDLRRFTREPALA